MFYDLREWESALEVSSHALDLLQETEPTPKVDQAIVIIRNISAQILIELDRHVDAIRILELDNLEGKDLFNQASIFQTAGLAFVSNGEHEKAVLEFRKSRLILETFDDNIFVAGSYSNLLINLSLAESKLERYDDAEASLLTALESHQVMINQVSFHESMSEQLAKIYRELGFVQGKLNKTEDSIRHLVLGETEFASLVAMNPGKVRYHTQLVGDQLDLLDVLFAAEQFDKASKLLERADVTFSAMPVQFDERTYFLQTLVSGHLDLVAQFQHADADAADDQLISGSDLFELLEAGEPDSPETIELGIRLTELSGIDFDSD